MEKLTYLLYSLFISCLTETDDYLDLEPGRFNGDSVFIQAPEFRGCAQLTVAGDVIPEGNETLQLQFVTIAFTSINAKFVIDPNVTEVIIIDDDEEIASMFIYNYSGTLYSGHLWGTKFGRYNYRGGLY